MSSPHPSRPRPIPTNPSAPDDRKVIDWRNSLAKHIILSDLEEGILSLDELDVSPEEAWTTVYGRLAEFKDVPFRQFRDRLKDHRDQIRKSLHNSTRDALAFAHDRQLYPRKTHNHLGEPVFDKSEAEEPLREDVKNGRHEVMSARDLQATREEYAMFDPNIFRHRIYQEVRRQKFVYYLEVKRAKKMLKLKQQISE